MLRRLAKGVVLFLLIFAFGGTRAVGLPTRKSNGIEESLHGSNGTPVALAFWKGGLYVLRQDSTPGVIASITRISYNGKAIAAWRIPAATSHPEDGKVSAADMAISSTGIVNVLLANGALYTSRKPCGPWSRSAVNTNSSSDYTRLWYLPDGRLVCLAGSCFGSLFEHSGETSSWVKVFPSEKWQYSVVDGEGGLHIVRALWANNGPDVFSVLVGSKQTWQELATVDERKLSRNDEAAAEQVVQFCGPSIFLAGSNGTGDPGMLYFSMDSGVSWVSSQAVPDHSLGESGGGASHLPMVEDGLLTGSKTAVALISNRILVTKDAGRSWKRAWYSKHAWETRLYRAPDGALWVLGTDILKSKDDGQTWELVLRIKP